MVLTVNPLIVFEVDVVVVVLTVNPLVVFEVDVVGCGTNR